MNSYALERDLKLVEALKNIMGLYNNAIIMDIEKKQRLILHYLIFATKQHEELKSVTEACEKTDKNYPKGFPHDSTLLQEAMNLVNISYKEVFPVTSFDEDMIVYKICDMLIKEVFDSIPLEEFKKNEQLIINNLWEIVHCTLVDNPNFKGTNPHYKRNYYDMSKAKDLWVEILDDRFLNYIDFFNCPEED